jgi:hypothetical protein
MAGEAALGRAVLELSTDGKQLDAGLSDVPKKVQKVGESVKGLAGPLGQVNGLLETFGVGLSIGAVIQFGRSLLELGDNVMKVHDRTGLATDDVQRLQFIAEQSGNSIDDLTGSISKLQVRLADGKGRKGIEALGLNFEKIRNESPYQALADVAQAIEKIESPTLRAQRAVEVFGKSGTEILPTLVSHFKELGDAAPVASEETIRALDDAGDAINKFGSTLKVWAAESYNYARGFFDKLVAETYRMVQRLYENAAGLAALAAKLPGASKLGIDQKLVASLKESSLWYRDVANAMDTNTVAAKKNAPAVAALPPIHKEASKEAKAHADAIANLTEKLSGAGAIEAARNMVEALRRLPPIQKLTKDAQIEIAKTMETAIAVYAAAGQSIPRDLQLIAMAARAASHTVSDATKSEIEAMQRGWAQGGGIKLTSIPIAFGFEDPTWQTRQTLKATQSFVGIVSQVDTVAVGAAAAKRMKDLLPPNFWQQTFGSSATFGANLGAAIMGAIQGGGNVFNAAGGFVGQSIGTSIAKNLSGSLLKEGAGMLSQAMGGLLNAVLPGVGALLGPLLGKAWDGIKKLFGADRSGRKLVESFIADNFGSASNLQQQLLALGPEYDRLWRGLTQLGDNASTAEAKAAIDAVTTALEANKKKTAEAADAAAASAESIAASQKAAVDEITARYSEGFKKIDDEYKRLNDSVSAEAEEAEMGAQERADRARMADLEKERAALELQQKTELEAKQATFGQVIEAGKETRGELDQIFGGEPLKIPYEFIPQNSLPAPIPMAEGGYGRITRPTLFYSGGDEDFAFSGEGRSFGLGAMANRPIIINSTTTLDGRVVARNQATHLPNELERVGVRSR